LFAGGASIGLLQRANRRFAGALRDNRLLAHHYRFSHCLGLGCTLQSANRRLARAVLGSDDLLHLDGNSRWRGLLLRFLKCTNSWFAGALLPCVRGLGQRCDAQRRYHAQRAKEVFARLTSVGDHNLAFEFLDHFSTPARVTALQTETHQADPVARLVASLNSIEFDTGIDHGHYYPLHILPIAHYAQGMSLGPTRVVIVEDQTIFRELLAEVLRADARMSIVAQYSEGREALERCPEVNPDLVILDVVLPDISGLDVLNGLLAWKRNLPVVMVTAHPRPASVRDAVRAGARAFVTKSTPLSELRTAVERALSGGRYFCSVTGPILADALKEPNRDDDLTPRQREVVQLIARGMSSKEIADQLSISHKTVANHRLQIREKLGLTDIASLTRYAIDKGWIEPTLGS
jgi:DNA-binding NarL/FixJ family response regulator